MKRAKRKKKNATLIETRQNELSANSFVGNLFAGSWFLLIRTLKFLSFFLFGFQKKTSVLPARRKASREREKKTRGYKINNRLRVLKRLFIKTIFGTKRIVAKKTTLNQVKKDGSSH